jgi:RND family efflux transporter MFP subunit
MQRRAVVALSIVLIAAGGAFTFTFSRRGAPSYQFAQVTLGSIDQEVLASGDIESPSVVLLYFKNSGTLESLPISVGEHVNAGETLASEDSAAQSAQLAEAEAALAQQTALLQKIQTGPRPESIAVAEASVAIAKQALLNLYASVPAALSDANAKAKDAVLIQIGSFFSNGDTDAPSLSFYSSDSQLSSNLTGLRVTAKIALHTWDSGSSLSSAAQNGAIASDLERLSKVQELLSAALQAASLSTSLSASDAASYRLGASSGLAEVTKAIAALQDLQQSILSSQSATQKAQADLSLASAGATGSDVAAQEAAVAAASAHVDVIRAQLKDSKLIAPISGTITDTEGQIGEIVSPGRAVVSLMPEADLEIKVHVSEDKVVGIRAGERARVELDAIAGEGIPATVVSIDPAQTIIGGAVYYETTLHLDAQDKRIKPGMSANVWIETGSASSTLLVPASAISLSEGKTVVTIRRGNATIERQVSTGLKDQKGMVEIRSGLEAGDTVVLGEK